MPDHPNGVHVSELQEHHLNRLAVAAFRAYHGAAVDGRLLVGWQLTLWRDVARAVLTAHNKSRRAQAAKDKAA